MCPAKSTCGLKTVDALEGKKWADILAVSVFNKQHTRLMGIQSTEKEPSKYLSISETMFIVFHYTQPTISASSIYIQLPQIENTLQSSNSVCPEHTEFVLGHLP